METSNTRRPTVAGQFYPGSERVLREEVNRLLPTVASPRRAWGVVAPHAGYMYSGATAGKTFATVQVPETVVLIGPNHYGLGEPFAVWGEGRWLTPTTEQAVDEQFTLELLQSAAPLRDDHVAHSRDHCLEVELPFLGKLNPQSRIVPIILGSHHRSALDEIARGIAATQRRLKRELLIVASSDMNHFEPQKVSERKDRLAMDRMVEMDEAGLLDVVETHDISMCGAAAAYVMLKAAKALGARKAELVDYRTSGDVTGDYESVVGYAGLVVSA
ncbi:MAG: AmmeMemoRadiSam system protein B [Verrucomicrobia bacterium]|nr:AmmeMemoRadiSam system protein B [Verrucomicrobiota bacterium]